MRRTFTLLAALAFTVAGAHGNDGNAVGQIRARDAHALLWLPDGRLLFGHHDGVQVSSDRGATWKPLLDKPNFDAMNLQLAGSQIVLAGHDVYATSPDGKRWTSRTVKGLKGTDLHGYAVEPGKARRHYAWEAATGLQGSADGGRTWKRLAAQHLPQGVVSIAAGVEGNLYALTARRGLWHSRDGGKSFTALRTPEQPLAVTVAADGSLWIGGKTGVWRRRSAAWARIADEMAILLAVNPRRPNQAVWVDGQGAVHRTEN